MNVLNLLSPSQKEALRMRVVYAMLERLMITLVFFTLLSGGLLILAKMQLSKNLAEIESRQILTSEYVTVNDDVKALEQQIARVETLQRMAISPSALLQDIAGRTPEGIAIASLGFDLAAAKLDLTGIAAKREDLLAYEEAMRASPFVKQLDSPISNLLRKTDANFQFAIQLNVEAMKKAYEPAP